VRVIAFTVMLNQPELANPILSKEEAANLLRPHFADFRSIEDGAWQKWMSLTERHKLDNRARANIVHCFIVDMALEKFSKVKGTKAVRGGNTFWLYIGDHIKTRFKKLDRKKLYRNYPTLTQLKLALQGNIPGILPGTYLTLGYLLDDLEQNIEQHLVTLQIGKRVIYEIDIDAELGQTSVPVVRMPTPAPQPAAERRVRPRRSVAAKEAKARGNAAGRE
jgi:hypothetical protein